MASEFDSGFSVLPPIGEGNIVKESSTAGGNILDVSINSVKLYNNIIDTQRYNNIIGPDTGENIQRKQKTTGKIRKHHRRNKENKELVKADLDKAMNGLPSLPFHSILDQRPFSRRSKDVDDR